MRYRLRTLLILLAIGPPILGWFVWPRVRETYIAWQSREAIDGPMQIRPDSGGVSGLRATSLRLLTLQIRLSELQAESERLELLDSPAALRFSPEIERAMLYEATQRK